MSEINDLIAENILKWKRFDGPAPRYQRAGVEAGSAEKCPNFLESPEGQALLRHEMARLGFTLDISQSPTNWETNSGKTSTAVFLRNGRKFESTQPYEYWAVCLAALIAVGHTPTAHDNMAICVGG
jgi:hypothetical protein